MPKTTKSGKPKKSELPSTIERSDDKAQRTFAKAHDSAAESYGEGRRAYQTAYSALKHTHEKVGDHWEPKDQKGPSDKRAADPNARKKKGGTKTGGVDVVGNTKDELMQRAKKLGITGRSRMTKPELVEAIKKANRRESRKALE